MVLVPMTNGVYSQRPVHCLRGLLVALLHLGMGCLLGCLDGLLHLSSQLLLRHITPL